jgi:hypothetical protein
MIRQDNPGIISTLFKYTFFASVVLFVLAILAIALHFLGVPVFSVMPGDSGIISIPVPNSKQTAFTKSPITSDLSCNFVSVKPLQYTISFDAFLKGDFITTTVPRVILYRSPYPISLQRTDTIDVLPTLFRDSNIIVYVDPLKNDLYVAALKMDSTHMTSGPIKNVPLRVPFRITIVVSANFLEVYLNGNLKETLSFNGSIITSPSTTHFFGPPPIINESIQIGNIQLWDSELSSKLINMYGNEKISSSLFKY